MSSNISEEANLPQMDPEHSAGEATAPLKKRKVAKVVSPENSEADEKEISGNDQETFGSNNSSGVKDADALLRNTYLKPPTRPTQPRIGKDFQAIIE